MAMWKKAMDYLGLGPDDSYDEYDVAPEPERPQRAARQPRDDQPRQQRGYANDYEQEAPVRSVPAPSTRRRRNPRCDDVRVRNLKPQTRWAERDDSD